MHIDISATVPSDTLEACGGSSPGCLPTQLITGILERKLLKVTSLTGTKNSSLPDFLPLPPPKRYCLPKRLFYLERIAHHTGVPLPTLGHQTKRSILTSMMQDVVLGELPAPSKLSSIVKTPLPQKWLGERVG